MTNADDCSVIIKCRRCNKNNLGDIYSCSINNVREIGVIRDKNDCNIMQNLYTQLLAYSNN